MSSFAIAGVQMTVGNRDNTDEVEAQVRRALKSFPWVQMVVVGEAAPVGFRQDLAVELPGPTEGEIVHEAGETDEVLPVIVDLERVRRVRHVGFHGLGQVLKSFRDNPVVLPAYQVDRQVPAEMAGLGPLRMPRQHDMVARRMADQVIDFVAPKSRTGTAGD